MKIIAFIKQHVHLRGKKKFVAALVGVAASFATLRYPQYAPALENLKYFVITYILGESGVDIARAVSGTPYDSGAPSHEYSLLAPVAAVDAPGVSTTEPVSSEEYFERNAVAESPAAEPNPAAPASWRLRAVPPAKDDQ